MLRLLGDIVAKDAELEVVGTAKDGVEAYELIKTKQPDVMLLDIVMPKLDVWLGVVLRLWVPVSEGAFCHILSGSLWRLPGRFSFQHEK